MNRINLDKKGTSFLKGVAICLVVFGHIMGRNGLPVQFAFFASFGVSIFLLISGYGLTLSFMKNGLDGFFRKRVQSVLIPFAIITLLLYSVGGELFNKPINVLTTIFLINSELPLDRSMWYIQYIFIWYAVFYSIFILVKQNSLRVALLMLFSVLLYKTEINNINVNSVWQFKLHAFEFPIGVALAFFSMSKSKAKLLAVIFGVLFIASYYYLCLVMKDDIYNLSGVVFSIFAFFVSLSGLGNGFLSKVGDYSYELYLLEGFLLAAFLSLSSVAVINMVVYLMTLFVAAVVAKTIFTMTNEWINKRLKYMCSDIG